MFVAKKQEMVLAAKTRALNAPRYRFFASIKECLELLVSFMNKILIHETFKNIIC